jgi:hypothetical protein
MAGKAYAANLNGFNPDGIFRNHTTEKPSPHWIKIKNPSGEGREELFERAYTAH